MLFTNPQTASSGTQEGDGDFVGVTGERLYFGINERTITYDITINDDDIIENNETFVVRIVKQNPGTYVDETIVRCIITITDNECKIYSFSRLFYFMSCLILLLVPPCLPIDSSVLVGLFDLSIECND